jgi:cyclomaltodextrinase / maltogenic alpha-amylase / neopullulanase
MEEFIFGTLATDELKLVSHRANRRGLQHAHDILPPDPEPDQPVTLTVRVGPDVRIAQVVCYYTLDGSEPLGEQGVAQHGHVIAFERAGVEWDTIVWGYSAVWKCQIPAQPEGTIVRYRISGWSEFTPEIFADYPLAMMASEAAAKAFFRNEPVPIWPSIPERTEKDIFTYHVDSLTPPQWARDSVIYHIFVDRFSPGQGRDWRQTSNLRDFCGGTLWGVIEHMNYVQDLGATALWLSPVFPSPTCHGYDATDYLCVEDRMGGDEALRSLVDEAHRRGLHVILDLVANHISHEHPIFKEALANPASPYRDWFTFDEPEIGYRTFFGVHSMPQLNVSNMAAREWMLDIARFWLREYDVDGYRLDHANGPGPSFWSDFWAACKAEKPDSFHFAEVVEPPSVQREYVGRLDGTLDFYFADAVRRTFGRKSWTRDQLASFIRRHQMYFPDSFLLPTFVDNHDMDRFLFIADGDKDALKQAVELQMRMPGPPIIYYGSEIGLEQRFSKESNVGLEASREPMEWGAKQDRDLLAFYREQIAARKQRMMTVSS